MAGRADIKAGSAFVELSVRDGMAAGLARAQARLATFAAGVKSMSLGLKHVGSALTHIGIRVAAVGSGITGMMGAAVAKFLEVSKRAGELGSKINSKKAQALAAAIEHIKDVWGAVQFRTGEALAGPLTEILNVLSKVGVMAANFIRDNQTLVVILAAVGVSALVAGVAIYVLGAAITTVGNAVGLLAGFLAFMLTPMGAAIVLVAVLAAAALLLAAAFGIMAEKSTGAVSGLLAALARGDMIKAWAITTQAMQAMWKTMAFGIESVWFGMIGRIIKAMDDLVLKSGFLQSIFSGLGAGVAGKKIGALASGASSAVQTGAQGQQTTAAFDMAKSLAELAKLSKQSRDDFMKGFAGVSISVPDMARAVNSGNRQGFGSTGSFNASSAGQNRSLGGIKEEQKKTNEHLDRIIKILNETKAKSEVEFAP